eukprot:CAMPEP_0185016430 /NCGR_PEP_ID=MMETSP1098-20130426/100363_1 /TAXON_ID=89044 /ORGANISM="Spumella elongata, Strain CCAP 955/1" /LENGTH=362 /DNA_ID=CAMNT_0027545625 /DNA_START=137 /DNA_END=1225 /DNA_ORIENTATION=-
MPYQDKPFTISIKADNINVINVATFCERYLHPPIIVGSFDKAVEAGTIVEFSECPPFTKKVQSWLLKQPSLVRSGCTDVTSIGQAQVQFSRAVVISVEEALDEPIEIVNINFDVPSKEGAGHCARGRNVTFKHCRFSSLGSGFSIGDRNRLGDNAGRASVNFEDCVFESCDTGLVVAGEGHATLRRCTFRGNRMGIEVKDGGTAVLVDCSLQESGLAAIHVHRQGRCVDVMNCTVEKSVQHGVLVADGCTARMHNVIISQCEESGVFVQGGASSTSVTMESCEVSSCCSGITTESGKVKVAVSNTRMYDNTEYGVCAQKGSVGEVSLTKCEVKNSGKQDTVCIEGNKCCFFIDGKREALYIV